MPPGPRRLPSLPALFRVPDRTVVGGAITLALGVGIGRFAFTPVLPMMQADAGLTLETASWLAAANYIGYLLGALVGVRWRLASPTAIRLGLLAVALVTLGMGMTADHLEWLLLRALAGGATACVFVATSAWTLARMRSARSSNMVFGGVGLGIAAAGTVVLGAMAVGATSSETWVILGLIALGVTGASWHTLLSEPGHERKPAAARPSPATLAQAPWHHGGARLLVACYGAFGFAYIIPATFLPAAARQAVAEPLLFGWSWPLFGAAGMLSTLAARHVADRWTDRQIWVRCYVTMAVGVAFPVLAPGLGPLLLSSLTVGGTFLVITTVALREATALAGVGAPQLIAAMTAAFAVGQIVGPLAAAYLAHVGAGLDVALVAAAGLLLGCAVLLTVDARRAQTVRAIVDPGVRQ